MKFSQHYKICKSQEELEFVDIDLIEDLELFVDPYIFNRMNSKFALECKKSIINYFTVLINMIRNKNELNAKRLLRGLSEPSETHLGLSYNSIFGNSIGDKKANLLYNKFANSRAVKTGSLKDLSDCELMIKGIGKDNISDITTNIIKRYLIQFTKEQCKKYEIPMNLCKNIKVWDDNKCDWIKIDSMLPFANGKPIILVPKRIVTDKLILSYYDFYNKEILEYYRVKEINAMTGLVIILKGGQKRVTKKELKKKYPMSKDFIYDFINENPESLDKYKKRKALIDLRDVDEIIYKAHEKNKRIN